MKTVVTLNPRRVLAPEPGTLGPTQAPTFALNRFMRQSNTHLGAFVIDSVGTKVSRPISLDDSLERGGGPVYMVQAYMSSSAPLMGSALLPLTPGLLPRISEVDNPVAVSQEVTWDTYYTGRAFNRKLPNVISAEDGIAHPVYDYTSSKSRSFNSETLTPDASSPTGYSLGGSPIFGVIIDCPGYYNASSIVYNRTSVTQLGISVSVGAYKFGSLEAHIWPKLGNAAPLEVYGVPLGGSEPKVVTLPMGGPVFPVVLPVSSSSLAISSTDVAIFGGQGNANWSIYTKWNPASGIDPDKLLVATVIDYGCIDGSTTIKGCGRSAAAHVEWGDVTPQF